jgi:phosphoadenosine phosphosulfate reductase
MRNAPYNPLYEKGLARIGCWLCPASDMGEFALYRHGGWEQFEQFLKTCARENNLPETWLDLGMWRWHKPPNWSPITYEIHMKRTALCPDGKKRIANFMAILGQRAPSELDEETVEAVRRRALFCVGCGVCVAKCPQDAITLKDGRAWIGEDCVHCLACMEECPVLVFW